MASTKKPATYADIEALPENVVGEIIDDELFVSPRPRTRHGYVANAINADLVNPFQRGNGGPGGWWLLPEPELHLGKQVIVPDIAGWRKERMPFVPDVVGVKLAPDWVCEILSPSTWRLDRMKKMRKYARHEVGHAWLVDPVMRTLEVFRRQGEAWLLLDIYGDDQRIRAEPFDAIELDLARWWPQIPEPTRASEPRVAFPVPTPAAADH